MLHCGNSNQFSSTSLFAMQWRPISPCGWRARALPVVLSALLLIAIPSPIAATPTGTLDQLAVGLRQKMHAALAGQELQQVDLALTIVGRRGVSFRLTTLMRQLCLGQLTTMGFRSLGELKTGQEEKRLIRQARREGYEYLLRLELAFVESHLHLRGRLHATSAALWRDIRQPDQGILHHLHSSVRVDAEIRTYQEGASKVPLRFAPRMIRLPPGEVLALGAGDIDSDGRCELVVLYPHRIAVLRGSEGAFLLLTSWEMPLPSAALKPRRVMGSLVVVAGQQRQPTKILLRSSEQERGFELTYDGKALILSKEIKGYPMAVASSFKEGADIIAQALPGMDHFDPQSLIDPSAARSAERFDPGIDTYYMLKGVTIASAEGPQSYTGIVGISGQLHLFKGRQHILPGVRGPMGIAFDLVDLDDNGLLELVLSNPGSPEELDQISVLRLSRTGRLRKLWHSESIMGQVLDITHGDFNGNGRWELVCAIRSKDNTFKLMVLN